MKKYLFLLFGAALVFGVLVLPNHPDRMNLSALMQIPLELPFILLLVLAVDKVRGVVTAVALLLSATVLLKLADYGTFLAYDRPFNPILDLFLIKAGLNLLADSIGGVRTLLASLGAVAALVVLFVGLRWGLKAWANLALSNRARAGAFAGAVLSLGFLTADVGHHLRSWTFDQSPPGTSWTTYLTVSRALKTQEMAADLARFRTESRNDPMEDMANVLNRLDGRDVLLIWIESYGRASFDNPLYAPAHGRTLSAAQSTIAQQGLAMKSGWLTSPTAGGQSWLAHGAFASGLWTSNQGRYTAMLASGQKWLFHFARDAGYRTAAFMPAITLAWPESAAMGFDLVYPAADIPYRGEPFNWVTMPDQFTLSAYDALLPPDDRPDFIQIALISSHAPWTPVPEMVPWNTVGDGRIFNAMAAEGPTPRELWKDRDNVRDAYKRSVDYSLRAVFSHVARLGEDAPLMIVAGDHQAAGFVAGSDNRDVPVHMIGPPDVVEMIDAWGWTDGLVPAEDGPVRRMDSFRDDFLSAFTTPNRLAREGP